jgi:hypothetical protein
MTVGRWIYLAKTKQNNLKLNFSYYLCGGEMAEWSIAAVLKTVEGQTSGGSNPSFSAFAHIGAHRCRLTHIERLSVSDSLSFLCFCIFGL